MASLPDLPEPVLVAQGELTRMRALRTHLERAGIRSELRRPEGRGRS